MMILTLLSATHPFPPRNPLAAGFLYFPLSLYTYTVHTPTSILSPPRLFRLNISIMHDISLVPYIPYILYYIILYSLLRPLLPPSIPIPHSLIPFSQHPLQTHPLRGYYRRVRSVVAFIWKFLIYLFISPSSEGGRETKLYIHTHI